MFSVKRFLHSLQISLLSLSVLASMAHAEGEAAGASLFDDIQNGIDQAALASQASLVRALQGHVRISTNATSDSSAEVEGSVPQGTHWLMIQITKIGTSEPSQVGATLQEGPTFKKTIYLNQGPGDYSVTIFTSTAETRANHDYRSLDRVTLHNSDPRDLRFLAPSSEVQADNPEIQALAQAIVQASQTENEKSTAIHAWITQNIAYDVESYFSQPQVAPPSDAVTTLHRRKAFCEGYANLNAALHRAAGIRARVIRGATPAAQSDSPSAQSTTLCQAPNHGWNEILINGQWLVQDTTWDAGFVNASQQFTASARRKYLFPEPATLALDHLRCEVSPN